MATPGTTPLLQISNLTIAFGDAPATAPAVKGVRFTINRGEIMALVGESGSGKSITSLSILRLLPTPPAVYHQGQILFSEDGRSVVDLLQVPDIADYRGNRIGTIFQEPMSALNPVMTCGRQVAEVLRRHRRLSKKEARAEAIGWLEKVRMPNPAAAYDKYPHQMSGGQKQRVMIAMAICCRPALLICDEPTTALDVSVQQHILQLIAELQQESGMGVLFITHDLGVVKQIAHRAAILYRGELVETGTTAALFNQPQHPYTRALLACRPATQPKGFRLPVVSDFMNTLTPVREPVPTPVSKRSGKVLVEVNNLEVRFTTARNFWGRPIHSFTAVDSVSFNVQEGETLGLVGESGCGKTTLGRCLLKLEQPTSGTIQLAGKDLSRINPDQLRAFRKDVQLVFQDPFAALNPRLTIGAAIEEPMMLQGAGGPERRRRVKELLDLVELTGDAASRYPHEFSGGQRQRIVIARALAPGPAFLVCDESVSALDVSVQAQVLNLLNDLKAELGLTLLFISHDLGVVRYISDRIMVMQKGRIVEQGDAETVFTQPREAYTQQLLTATPH